MALGSAKEYFFWLTTYVRYLSQAGKYFLSSDKKREKENNNKNRTFVIVFAGFSIVANSVGHNIKYK